MFRVFRAGLSVIDGGLDLENGHGLSFFVGNRG